MIFWFFNKDTVYIFTRTLLFPTSLSPRKCPYTLPPFHTVPKSLHHLLQQRFAAVYHIVDDIPAGDRFEINVPSTVDLWLLTQAKLHRIHGAFCLDYKTDMLYRSFIESNQPVGITCFVLILWKSKVSFWQIKQSFSCHNPKKIVGGKINDYYNFQHQCSISFSHGASPVSGWFNRFSSQKITILYEWFLFQRPRLSTLIL